MEKTDGCGCISVLALLVFNLVLGAMSVNWLLAFFMDKTIPFLGAMLIGLFVGQFSVPVSIVVWLLHSFGVM